MTIMNPSSVASLSVPRYDVIDLDPYGSVSPFIDAAVQATSGSGYRSWKQGTKSLRCTIIIMLSKRGLHRNRHNQIMYIYIASDINYIQL